MADENIETRESMDSDEVMDMFCESCFKDGIKNVPAVVFCVDCVSFFCKTCLKFHTKFLPDHRQQSHTDMPTDFCQENCTTHQNEIVKYYCKKCDCFACSNCKHNDHEGCEPVHYIPTLLNEFDQKKEYLNFKDMLQSVEEKIQETKLAIEHGYRYAKQSKGDIKNVIQEYKENTAKMFDDLEREVTSETDKISAQDEKNLAEISTKLSKLESSFKAIKSENESKKVTHQRCKIFMMVKSCYHEIKSIKNDLENFENETEVHEVKYEPANVIKSTSDFGELKINKSGQSRNSRHKSEDKKRAKRKQKDYSTCLWVVALVAVIIPVIAALIYGDIYYGKSKLENVFNAKETIENLPKSENVFSAKESPETTENLPKSENVVSAKESPETTENLPKSENVVSAKESPETTENLPKSENVVSAKESPETTENQPESENVVSAKESPETTENLPKSENVVSAKESPETTENLPKSENVVSAKESPETTENQPESENVVSAKESPETTENLPESENVFNGNESNENRMSIIREEQIIIAEADISSNIENTPHLFKLCHLHKNYLIALDRHNGLLLLISTVDKKIVSDFQPENWPLDITKVGENKIAVIFYSSSEIHIIQINNMHIGGVISWSVAKKVKTELAVNPNHTIAYRNDKVFVLSQKEISVFDLNGNTLKTIFFSKPDEFYPQGYLTIRKTDETLHIISWPGNKSLQIIHVTPDEVYETSFSHKDLWLPVGMAADDKGNVYACGHVSDNIYVLSGDLTKGEVLLDKTDGIKNPLSIAYSNEDKNLFIFSFETNIISVFKIL